MHWKNYKIRTKLKKLAKLKSGKTQLNKFLKGRRRLIHSDESDNVFTENENDESNERRRLIHSDESDNVFTENENDESNKQDSESTEITSRSIIDDSPRRASTALKSLTPELQRNNNRIDSHDEQIPLENYENIRNARSPTIDNNQSPVRSPGNQHAQSSLPHNTVNNDDDERSVINEYVETPSSRRRKSCIVYRQTQSPLPHNHSLLRSPRNQHAQLPLPHNHSPVRNLGNQHAQNEHVETPPSRRRSCIVYRPKRVLRELAEERDDTDDDNIYNNRLSSDIREVNPENFELYQKEGDEVCYILFIQHCIILNLYICK
ncbi:uncharacterized protein [Temnothorax nylanderi]|uniref:uncharacterized protein n=1 Tax=Temnothorax nylanderi TaxID=102681 RepID=UPI003A8ADA7C